MATLKQKKANPNSKYWRKKADDIWSDVIKQVGQCEYCGNTIRQLHSHHILARTRPRFRHDISNGVCLCSTCHNFDPTISPHQDSYGGERFLEWLKLYRPGQFVWYQENKEDKRQKEKTYEQCFNELKEIFEKGK